MNPLACALGYRPLCSTTVTTHKIDCLLILVLVFSSSLPPHLSQHYLFATHCQIAILYPPIDIDYSSYTITHTPSVLLQFFSSRSQSHCLVLTCMYYLHSFGSRTTPTPLLYFLFKVLTTTLLFLRHRLHFSSRVLRLQSSHYSHSLCSSRIHHAPSFSFHTSKPEVIKPYPLM